MKAARHDAQEPLGFLICFAVKEEAAEAWPLEAEEGRHLLITGMGRRNASEQFRKALDRFTPDRVLTCGFAGALNPALKIGDVLFDADFDAGLADKLGALGALPAKFHCSTRVAVTVAEKTELRRTTGADAVEMESAVIRTLCRERKIPSATIRVISDTASEDLPLDFNALMTSGQKISFPKLALALIKSPQKVPRLMSLQSNTRLAAKRLAGVLEGLLHSISNGGSSIVCR
jgi:adenosylhomocysteine nucleosidase